MNQRKAWPSFQVDFSFKSLIPPTHVFYPAWLDLFWGVCGCIEYRLQLTDLTLLLLSRCQGEVTQISMKIISSFIHLNSSLCDWRIQEWFLLKCELKQYCLNASYVCENVILFLHHVVSVADYELQHYSHKPFTGYEQSCSVFLYDCQAHDILISTYGLMMSCNCLYSGIKCQTERGSNRPSQNIWAGVLCGVNVYTHLSMCKSPQSTYSLSNLQLAIHLLLY